MNNNNQQLIKTSIIIVIIAGALGTLSIASIGLASAKMLGISISMILFGITGTISMVVMSKPEYKGLGTAGVIVSLLAFLLAFILIVAEVIDEGLLKLAFALFIASIGLAHICLLHHFNMQNKYAVYARMTATIAISLFSLLLIMRTFESLTSMYALAYNQGIIQLILASLIIDLSATLLVPLCNRLQVHHDPVEFSFTQQETTPPAQTEEIPPANTDEQSPTA